MIEADRQALLRELGEEAEVRFDEPMARHTTLRIGGPVDAWVAPKTIEALRRLRALCHARQIPQRAFGAGSNLLVRDGGVRGVAISLRHLNAVSLIDPAGERGENLRIEAGATTGRVLALATRHSLGGVEFLGGVPGTVGGGLVMNAGTYLGEWKDVIVRVTSIDTHGERLERSNAECGFGYRTSRLPPDEVVIEATAKLVPRDRAAIEADVRALRDRRRDREPHAVPNNGSTFKNPPGDFAGRLIEAAGLKGRRIGGAEVSPVHANWLVNADGACARELLTLIELVRHEVAQKFGITLELEVKVVGEDVEIANPRETSR